MYGQYTQDARLQRPRLPANCQQPYPMLLTLPYVCGNDKMFVGMTSQGAAKWPFGRRFLLPRFIPPMNLARPLISQDTLSFSRTIKCVPSAGAAAVSVGSMRYIKRRRACGCSPSRASHKVDYGKGEDRGIEDQTKEVMMRGIKLT